MASAKDMRAASRAAINQSKAATEQAKAEILKAQAQQAADEAKARFEAERATKQAELDRQRFAAEDKKRADDAREEKARDERAALAAKNSIGAKAYELGQYGTVVVGGTVAGKKFSKMIGNAHNARMQRLAPEIKSLATDARKALSGTGKANLTKLQGIAKVTPKTRGPLGIGIAVALGVDAGLSFAGSRAARENGNEAVADLARTFGQGSMLASASTVAFRVNDISTNDKSFTLKDHATLETARLRANQPAGAEPGQAAARKAKATATATKLSKSNAEITKAIESQASAAQSSDKIKALPKPDAIKKAKSTEPSLNELRAAAKKAGLKNGTKYNKPALLAEARKGTFGEQLKGLASGKVGKLALGLTLATTTAAILANQTNSAMAAEPGQATPKGRSVGQRVGAVVETVAPTAAGLYLGNKALNLAHKGANRVAAKALASKVMAGLAEESIAKGAAKFGLKKVAPKLIPGVGWALTAYSIVDGIRHMDETIADVKKWGRKYNFEHGSGYRTATEPHAPIKDAGYAINRAKGVQALASVGKQMAVERTAQNVAKSNASAGNPRQVAAPQPQASGNVQGFYRRTKSGGTAYVHPFHRQVMAAAGGK